MQDPQIVFAQGSRQEIIDVWRLECAAVQALFAVPTELWQRAPANKWNAAQHLDHLCRSANPVALSLKVPAWLLQIALGKPRRPKRSYNEVVAAYKSVLAGGGKATGRFVPPPAVSTAKAQQNWTKAALNLQNALLNASEERLDDVKLPHPLLGGLSQREMLFFTCYHTAYHRLAMEELLKQQ